MSTKFFTNAADNTLFDKLRGLAQHMQSFDRFLAVAGYFRSSGYFRLRRELDNVKEIKILVGLNIDDIFRHRNKAMLGFGSAEQARKLFTDDFLRDIAEARYAPEVEQGIRQLCEDLKAGRLQMRMHAQRNLHAKFYLCLPAEHTPDTDGTVIMGSSNISDAGLGTSRAPRYELNVAVKDFDDVDFCHQEFRKLWDTAEPLTPDDIAAAQKQTYLGCLPTPYELYIKVLIEAFGPQVEDDFLMQLPDGVRDLKYQRDAVIQGYQMLMRHNGVFLADVVGLGKTLIATMIAKRFIEANGSRTNILVVAPPSIMPGWRETFRLFAIDRHAQFVTNGSLSKILDHKDQYKDKEEFALVIVDEAHGFRNDGNSRYDELQKICKAPCRGDGLLRLPRKKVMLLSATPLNNRPEDLQNLILLFQDSQRCTIDGVPSVDGFFAPRNEQYKKLMRERGRDDVDEALITAKVDQLYAGIRQQVLDKITVRRTRHNIMADPAYADDLKAQGITFPNILPPTQVQYQLPDATAARFRDTLAVLTGKDANGADCEPKLHYARYRAVEFLSDEKRAQFSHAEQTAKTLAGVYRMHMVKRLESSFHAFRKSLHTLLRITDDMRNMLDNGRVLIANDMDVTAMLNKGMELDTIIERALAKGHTKDDFVFATEDFNQAFREKLDADHDMLVQLCAEWDAEQADPKFDKFAELLRGQLFATDINPTGKLVLFSESVDTLRYLHQRLTQDEHRDDVLLITSENRSQLHNTIRQNFDANLPAEEQQDQHRVIITSDVLAEGINLHRANVIINYDTPWNATRLMQRIGRVNRIGSVAGSIHNYMFYPSDAGNHEIRLKENAIVKLQGFHSAFGEDAQIFSRDEIVRQFQLYDPDIHDQTDTKIRLLREVRQLYATNPDLYRKIKKLPLKCRTMRTCPKRAGQTVAYIASPVKTEFYLMSPGAKPEPIDFIQAADIFRASPDEAPAPTAETPIAEHYQQVNRAVADFDQRHTAAADTGSINAPEAKDKAALEAKTFLRHITQKCHDKQLLADADTLRRYIDEGIYQQLKMRLRALAKEERKHTGFPAILAQREYELQAALAALCAQYKTLDHNQQREQQAEDTPDIVLSQLRR